MKNFISPRGNAFPYINLNGNSKEQIYEELFEVHKDICDLSKKIAKLDYVNGRNAISEEHRELMKSQKINCLLEVSKMKAYFEDILFNLP